MGTEIPLMNNDEQLQTLQVANNIILLHQECADIPHNDWPLKIVLIWMTQIFPLTVQFPFKFELFCQTAFRICNEVRLSAGTGYLP